MHESDGEAAKSGSLIPRRLKSVGTEIIGFPSEDDAIWADEVTSMLFVGHLGDPELRERALRVLAMTRVEETRELVLRKIQERWSTQPWAKEIDARLRSRWSRTVNPEIHSMFDMLSEIADAIVMQDVVGIYALAQTDHESTRCWHAGVYDRSKMAFAFGMAQLDIYHSALYGRDHDEDGDE